MSQSKRVIILGGHVTGLGLARALRPYSVIIDVWDSASRCVCRKSKYISEFREVPIHSTQRLLEHLRETRTESNNEVHVVPTDDLSTAILSKNKEELLGLGLNCWTDAWPQVGAFYDKRETYALAARVGVAHPVTVGAESVASVEGRIAYPVVLKPNAMEAFSQVHRCKGTICQSRPQLQEALDTYSPTDDSYVLLAQEYIPGGGGNQFSLAAFRDADGHLRGLGARRKRQYPPGVGTATYVETTDPSDMIEPSRRLLDEIDYVGVCEVEFKRDSRDGKLMLLEVNPRFFKWNALLPAADVDLVQPFLDPGCIKNDTEIPWRGDSIGWQDLFAEFGAILSRPGQLSGIGELLSDFRKKRADAVISATDWGPLVQYLRILPRLARGGRPALQGR